MPIQRPVRAVNPRIETSQGGFTNSGIARSASGKSWVAKLLTNLDGVANKVAARETAKCEY